MIVRHRVLVAYHWHPVLQSMSRKSNFAIELRRVGIQEERSSKASTGTRVSQSKTLTILTLQSDFPRPFKVGTWAFDCSFAALPLRWCARRVIETVLRRWGDVCGSMLDGGKWVSNYSRDLDRKAIS
jgi:hypothetical protein